MKEDAGAVNGTYTLAVNGPAGTEQYTLEVKAGGSTTLYANDTLQSKLTVDGKQIKFSYAPQTKRVRGGGAPALTAPDEHPADSVEEAWAPRRRHCLLRPPGSAD